MHSSSRVSLLEHTSMHDPVDLMIVGTVALVIAASSPATSSNHLSNDPNLTPNCVPLPIERLSHSVQGIEGAKLARQPVRVKPARGRSSDEDVVSRLLRAKKD